MFLGGPSSVSAVERCGGEWRAGVGLLQPKWSRGVISLTVQMFTKQHLCSFHGIFTNFTRIGI